MGIFWSVFLHPRDFDFRMVQDPPTYGTQAIHSRLLIPEKIAATVSVEALLHRDEIFLDYSDEKYCFQ